MIVQAVFDKHHRVIIGIVRFAGQRPVHVKYRDPVFHGNSETDIFLPVRYGTGVGRPAESSAINVFRTLIAFQYNHLLPIRKGLRKDKYLVIYYLLTYNMVKKTNMVRMTRMAKETRINRAIR